jgi:hypothetical protein
MAYDWSDRLGEAGWPLTLAFILITGAWSAIADVREGFKNGERRTMPSGVAVGFVVGAAVEFVHAVAVASSATRLR